MSSPHGRRSFPLFSARHEKKALSLPLTCVLYARRRVRSSSREVRVICPLPSMGVNPKFCKVTVHRASPSPPNPEVEMEAAPVRPRRQTIATEFESNLFFQRPPTRIKPRATERYTKVSEIIPDEEFDAMLQSAEQTRRRAKTDATSSNARMSGVEVIKGRKMNPLSRLTMRWTESRDSSKSAGASPFTTDDDDDDGHSNTIDIMDGLLDNEDDYDDPPLLDRRNCDNDSFLDCDTNETDPERQTMDDATKFFVAGTPPIPAGITLDMLPTKHTSPSLPLNFSRTNFYSSYASVASQSEDPFQQSLVNFKPDPAETDDDDTDDGTSSVATSSMLDYESEEEVNIDEMRNKAEAIARFESSFQNHQTPLFRTTEIPKSRQNRGMSSPPRMLSQIIRPRKQSHPVRPHHHASPADDETRIALYSGQTLHLNFKNSMSQVVQVSGQPRKSASKNIFSKRIRCQAIDDSAPIDPADALRIIGHSTDGIIQGGDCISIARNDGHVLRLQTLSKKLCFSPKIDLRAKFIVSGVPEGTIVTSKTKFYLQSVYDRSKTVGFLKSRRSSHPGYLVMYAYRNKEDKSEPIQFFKRAEGQPAASQQPINLQTSALQQQEGQTVRQERSRQQQQLAAEDRTPVNLLDDLTPQSQIILG
ncbi:hypothetical protein FI667_g13043, partial [Globisporangium splendens]